MIIVGLLASSLEASIFVVDLKRLVRPRITLRVKDPKFSDMCFCRSGKEVQADTRSRDRRETVDALVSDRDAFNKSAPVFARPRLDSEALHVLSIQKSWTGAIFS